MNKLWSLLFVILLLVAAGCNPVKDLSEAENAVATYYDTLKAGDFEKALGFYSAQFFEKSSKADTLQMLKAVNLKLGNLQEYKFVNSRVNSFTGTGGSYTRYNLDYETTYERGTAKETLTLIKSDTKFLIQGFNINSNDLLR